MVYVFYYCRFKIAARVGTRMFPVVVARNKKDGKKEAADVALRMLIAEGSYKANTSSDNIVS